MTYIEALMDVLCGKSRSVFHDSLFSHCLVLNLVWVSQLLYLLVTLCLIKLLWNE